MENASKALVIAGQVLIFVIALTIGINYYVGFQNSIKSILTSSERNSRSSEYATSLTDYEHFASKAEVIWTILSMKNDINKVGSFDENYEWYEEIVDTAFVPKKVVVDNLTFSRDDNEGLVSSYNDNDPEQNIASRIVPGYYAIDYFVNPNDVGDVTVYYTYAGATLESAREYSYNNDD